MCVCIYIYIYPRVNPHLSASTAPARASRPSWSAAARQAKVDP